MTALKSNFKIVNNFEEMKDNYCSQQISRLEKILPFFLKHTSLTERLKKSFDKLLPNKGSSSFLS